MLMLNKVPRFQVISSFSPVAVAVATDTSILGATG